MILKMTVTKITKK